MDTLKELYSYGGDEWSKILPYMINRQLGSAKANLEISRDSYPEGRFGNKEYAKALTNRAVEIAAERTIRETVTWSIAPMWAKQMSRVGFTFFGNDYVMHPLQMFRMNYL